MALDLDALVKAPAVSRAIADLRALSGRPLLIKHMKDWVHQDGYPKTLPSPALIPFDDRDEVYLNEKLPAHMAVHEITHAILREEGHPDYEFDAARVVRPSRQQGQFEELLTQFHNKLQHPEIYRRMEFDYGLPMGQYKAYVADQFHQQAKGHIAQGMIREPIGKQAQLFNVLDLLHLEPHSGKTLRLIEDVSVTLVNAAKKADEEFRAIGYSAPQQALRAFTAFWGRVIEFGVRAGDEPTNDLWRAVRWFLPPGSAMEAGTS